ncbi:dicarboxylate/amino acid:cation symporter [Compostibacter hankyongensis]|uniref:Glutamate/aspartate:proton symporter GltP n=1 Tax=Compostibacter hankyongensis TaxID=1007089 RepID=A0ABP8GAT7_9BACT
MNKKTIVPVVIILCTLAAFLTVLHHYGWLHSSPALLLAVRWAAIAGLVVYAVTKRSLTTWIFVSMIIGASLGHDVPHFAVKLQLLSKIFLRMIKTIIAPLIFSTLVVGIAGHSDLKQVGRMGWKSLVYFYSATFVALFIGLLAINVSRAGLGIHMPANAVEEAPPAGEHSLADTILHIFPENIARAVAEGEVLQIVIFAVIFGIALALLSEQKKKPLLGFCESLSETMFKFTNIIMYFAPVGVGCAIAYTVGHMGLGVLLNLFHLLMTLYVALVVFLLGVLLPVALFIRIPVRRFISAIAEPVSIAFATTSSDAALPKAFQAMERFGVPKRIVAFVIPTGYSFNLDGTTLYLSLAAVFVSQAAGVHPSFEQQLLMGITLIMTSKGVAAVPRASLVILLGTVHSFHLPTWPVFIILGIDELMDMGRTSVNVIGNCLASAVVARWEGEFDDEKARRFVPE